MTFLPHIVIMLLMMGCIPHSKVSSVDVLYSSTDPDGKNCLFYADGMTIEQAKELEQAWDFEHCNIEVGSEFHDDANAKMQDANMIPPKENDDEK